MKHDFGTETFPVIRRFIAVLKYLDIWCDNTTWKMVAFYHKRLSKMEALLDDPAMDPKYYPRNGSSLGRPDFTLETVRRNLGREWFLPMYLGDAL